MIQHLPRLLVLDDLFGRNVSAGRNRDRENLCGHFRWRDVTGDRASKEALNRCRTPDAEVVFCRAQQPDCSSVGDVVENSLESAMDAVRSGWYPLRKPNFPPWSLVLLDLCFYTGCVTDESNRHKPGMPEGRPADEEVESFFGLTLLDAIHREFPELPIYVLSSKPREEVSLQFSQRGALGFIARDDLRAAEKLSDAIWHHGLLPDANNTAIGTSLTLLLALRESRRAARHRQNIFIRGERGTGKELIARYLHQSGVDTCLRPFVEVNSGIFSRNLFASELFGIEPKTATGVDGKTGLIAAADGGDLFLDEVADMPPEAQAAILRVLQEQTITKVGGRKPQAVNVRFLSATNVKIEEKIHGFREDLLDRLRLGGTIWLPALRERKLDIPLLAEFFVREAESLLRKTRRDQTGSSKRRVFSDEFTKEISPDAIDRLLAHDWPGNVRELRTCIFDAVSRHPDVEHLVANHLRIEGAPSRRADAGPEPAALPGERNDADVEVENFLNVLRGVDFSSSGIAGWAGRLGEIQTEQSWLVARYLAAALEATKRRTPDTPEGVLQIHPAVKLAIGDRRITATRAADLLKRLLAPLADELRGDLALAWSTALRLRPKGSKQNSGGPSSFQRTSEDQR